MFKRILFPVDFTPTSEIAFNAGLALADRCGSEVLAVHVLTRRTHQSYFAAEGVGVDFHKTLEKTKLDRLVTQIDPEARGEILYGESVSMEILKYSQLHGCDLIVMGSHGRSAIGEMIIGSTTEQVIRESKSPVMMIREPRYGKTFQMEFERIMVPIDFSATSLRALALGSHFARFLGSQLHLVHIIDSTALHDLQRDHPDLDWDNPPQPEITRRVNKVLHGLIHKDTHVGHMKAVTLFGDAIHEILEYSTREDCKMIVMGSHGRKPMERLLLGSVSRGVLNKVHIPVITLSPILPSEDSYRS